MRGLKVSCGVSIDVIKYHGSRDVDVYNFTITMINTFTPTGHLVETGVWKGGASILMSHIVYACCGLWFVVCGLWFVVCDLWFVVSGFWFVLSGLRFVFSTGKSGADTLRMHALGQSHRRRIYVCDSFHGVPPPDADVRSRDHVWLTSGLFAWF